MQIRINIFVSMKNFLNKPVDKVKKRKITIILLSVLIISIVIIGYNYYKSIKEPVSPALNAIPDRATIIFKTKNTNNSWQKISESVIWKELIKIDLFKELNKEICFMDSVFKTNDNISNIINKNSTYISLHFSGYGKFNFLYLINLPNIHYESSIDNFIKKSCKDKILLNKRKYKDVSITEVKFPDCKKTLYYTTTKGIFIASFYSLLVEDAIRQLNSGNSIKDNNAFNNVYTTSGKNVDANIYINFKYFSRLFTLLFSNEHKDNVRFIADIAEWTELDVTIKNDELLLNGFTATDTTSQYLDLFTDQNAQKTELTKILPYNTAMFMFWGFENYNKFLIRHKSFLKEKNKINSYNKEIERLNNEFKFDIEKNALSWIGNEMALVVTKPSGSYSSATDECLTNVKDNTFAVFNTANIDTALLLLDDIANKVNTKLSLNPDTITFKKHFINHINIPRIMSTLFGSLFQKIETNYYTCINNYIIFANSQSSLQNFINSNLYGKTLNTTNANKSYNSFSENISDNSNLYLYCNIKKSINLLKYYVTPKTLKNIQENYSQIKNFEAVGIQLRPDKNMFYTNIYLKYNPSYAEEDNSLWKITLDTTISSQPFIIKDHIDNTHKIIVSDINNNLYLIDRDGKILWKNSVKEKIISNVQMIDYYKNGKFQYVFNTENYIYIIDRNGNNIENYPIKLKEKATNGLSVFDYDKNKDYRFILACSNKIYNYLQNGKINKAWFISTTKNTIIKPVQHIKINDIDYIIASDKQGNVLILDRKGKEKIKLKQNFITSPNSCFYTGNAIDRTKLLTTDENGKIVAILSDGNVETMSVKDFSHSHFFLYKDINNDKLKDFIFLDNNELSVYDHSKKLLFSHIFDSNINIKPAFINMPAHNNLIGIVSSKTKEVFLFDENGKLKQNSPFTGATPFCITNLNNDNQLNLIVGSVETIHNYILN